MIVIWHLKNINNLENIVFSMVDPFVEFVDDDRTKSGAQGIVETARIQSSKDDIFEFENSPLGPDDVETVDKPGGKGYEAAPNLEEDEFQQYKNTMSETDAFSFQRSQEYWRADVDKLPAPDPRKINQQRSSEAVAQDRKRKARVTTDVDRWASDPNSYDFPFVDTTTEFNKEFSHSTLGGTKIEGKSVFSEAGDDRVFEF